MSSKIAKAAATTNNSGAMETRDHFKNGASSKSQMSRNNFLQIIAMIMFVLPIIFAGCGKNEVDDNFSAHDFRVDDVVSKGWQTETCLPSR